MNKNLFKQMTDCDVRRRSNMFIKCYKIGVFATAGR